MLFWLINLTVHKSTGRPEKQVTGEIVLFLLFLPLFWTPHAIFTGNPYYIGALLSCIKKKSV